MSDDQEPKSDSLFGMLLRVYWIAGGFVSFIALASLYSSPPVTDSSATILFWGNAIGIVAARFLDIRYFHGTTKDGAPATMSHWFRYALVVAVLSTTGWLLVRIFGGGPVA